jgi:hypothetical protein
MTLWLVQAGGRHAGSTGREHDDPLTEAFARRGLDIVTIRPGRLAKQAAPASRPGIVYLESTGEDRAWLRRLLGTTVLGRAVIPRSVPVLIHQSLVSDSAALDLLGRFAADRTGAVYIAHAGLFRPAYLELARQIALETAGKPAGGVIRSTVSFPPGVGAVSGRPGRNRQVRGAFLEAADAVFRLFGPPTGFEVKTGTPPHGRSGLQPLQFTLSFRTCELEWEFIAGSDRNYHAVPAFEGSLECRNGTIGFSIAPDDGQGRDPVSVTIGGGRPYNLPLPEGGGAYYLALDTLEAVGERRGSGILPLDRFFEYRRAGMGLLKAVVDRYDTPNKKHGGRRTDG